MSRMDDTVNERQTPADTAVRQEGQRIASSAREQVDLAHLKVAIVHDWLVGGGAEQVVLELHKMFPEAPIYTSYCVDEWREKLDGKVVTGWLQYFGRLRKFMVLPRIWWFTHLDLSEYDLIISSSGNGEAFAVRKNHLPLRKRLSYILSPISYLPPPLHINYCHSPTHYYWRHYDQYMERPGFGIFSPLARWGLKLLVGPLRRWDYKAAQRADVVIANSTHIQADIKKYYHRDSSVVFPPVNTERFAAATSAKRSGFITAGRLAPMKRVDLIIEAANRLGLQLTVIGKGPAYDDLVKRAGPTVKLLGYVSNEELPDLLSSAEVFVFASFEDFGIAPVEAMAAGTPVIAYKAGGALDYIKPGITGEFFDEQTAESLISVLQNFDSTKYSKDDIKKHAETFSISNFRENMHDALLNVLK